MSEALSSPLLNWERMFSIEYRTRLAQMLLYVAYDKDMGEFRVVFCYFYINSNVMPASQMPVTYYRLHNNFSSPKYII